jgi:hypothetical protein
MQRLTFSQEFKFEAVKLVRDRGVSGEAAQGGAFRRQTCVATVVRAGPI